MYKAQFKCIADLKNKRFFNINDTVDADNVMSVINKNINDIAKGVGNAFSKGVNKSSGRKNWG